MAAAALLAATVKFDGSLTLQIRGDGPLSLLVVQARPGGRLRGLANWKKEVPAAGLQEIFGAAQLVITIDQGPERDQYQGVVTMQGETLADAISAYFAQSEQLPTSLWLAADFSGAAGLLLQHLPGDGGNPDAWVRAEQLAARVTDEDLLALPAIEIVRRLYHEEDIRFFGGQPMEFHCTCSRERSARMLKFLGQRDVRNLLDEQGRVEVTCEFCKAEYVFDAVDAEALFAATPAPVVGETPH
jgi:molecular chaperone Hsp33